MWTPWRKPPVPEVPPVQLPPENPNPPQVYELHPKITRADLIVSRSVLLKRLKWVNHKGRIAIVWELDSSGYATIHFVDEEGLTVDVDRVNATELALARFEEIPAKRRGNMSPLYAATLGYF
jgi:hypothetical protein